MNIKKTTAKYAVALLILACFAISAAIAQEGQSAKRPEITDIRITGNRAISSDVILTKVKLRVGDTFSQKAVNEDIKRLYALGFFTDVTAEAEDFEEGIRLIFAVMEKSIVGKVVFKGNKIYKEKVLLKEIGTRPEDVVNKRRLAEDMRKIKDFYKKKGYPLVNVDYSLEVDEETNRSTVYIDVNERTRYRIRKIDFEDNTAFNDKRLLKVIATKKAALFSSGFLDEDKLQQDMERVKAFYKQHGYIDAQASYDMNYDQDKKHIFVNIKVSEGEQYFVGKITMAGNDKFTEEKLRKGLKLKSGDPYNPDNLRHDLISIQTLYFDDGYMSCNVNPLTSLNRDARTLDVSFTIDEGALNYVNEVEITGNSKTKDVVIRRELRLYPGDRFDGKKLRRSKQRLYDLGFFDEVIFDTVAAEAPEKKDLVVSVKETKTGEFSFGGGYSSVDKFIGFVEITQRNFDISNWPTFTGAGQNLKLRAEIGSIRRNYLLSFTEPWIFGHPYLFGFDAYSYERKRESSINFGYDEEKTGGMLRFGKEFSDIDRADMRYKLEQVKISDVSEDATSALKDEEGENVISALALTLTRDTTDSKFNPMEGYIASITGEDAGGFLGGDKDFYKINGVVDYFFNYMKKLVFELKVRAGWADDYDDSSSVPIYERFFAGGANTVRGYKERSIGPRDAKTGDAIGGESMLVGNFEATYPIFKNFKIAAFYDVGNVWADANDFASGDLKSGVGMGIRVKTPIGPIKVDAGYPLDEAHSGDKKKVRFHFSMTRGF